MRGALLLLSLVTLCVSTNYALIWSDVLLNAIRFNKTTPAVATRALAIVNVAIHDALASVVNRYNAYNYPMNNAPLPANLDAIVVSSSRTTLASLFPNQVDTFNSLYFQHLTSIDDGTISVSNGLFIGRAVALSVIADRSSDGSSPYVPYVGSNAAGMWRPTPPLFLPADVPQWADMRPWCMTSDAEFRPPPPPDVHSAQYVADHNQIFSLGVAGNSSTRTPDQEQIAAFWYDGPATDTPAGTWDTVADQISIQRGYDVVDFSRLQALMALALADSAIMGWDAKYTYGQWRPITAIRDAQSVVPPTNPPLAQDSTWTPLLTTPNWPDYISDRAMFGGAASQLLTRLYGQQYSFTITSDYLGTTRSYNSFYDAAFEQGQSRVYAGSHFNTSVMQGLTYGRLVADWALDHCLQKKVTYASTSSSGTNAATNYAGVIAGSVIGGTLGIIFIILFAIFVFKKHPTNGMMTSSSMPSSSHATTNHDFEVEKL